MILIITHKEDFTADFVIDKLNKRGIEYYRFNCEDIDKQPYSFKSNNRFSFELDKIKPIYSIWFRRTKLPDLEMENHFEKLYLLGDYDSLLENIYLGLNPKKWLSEPKYVYQSENKLYQLKIAQSIGFNIPDTLVTSQHIMLKIFIEKHNQNVIVKPLRQGRIKYDNEFKTIFTNKLSLNLIEHIEEYTLTPSIFQEYINKEYELRVTVVGEKVFAAKVDSQKLDETKIDWRKHKTPFQKYSLPNEISDKCVQLTRQLNLSFGAIDIIKNMEGQYIFLEINPNGQWAWLEMEAGLKISDEIINYLTQ